MFSRSTIANVSCAFILAIGMCQTTLATYIAHCCKNLPGEMQEGSGCSDDTWANPTNTCEGSSPDATKANGGKWSTSLRNQICTEFSGTPSNFYSGSCTNSPGSGYVLVGENPDGSCCWVKGASVHPTIVSDQWRDDCTGVCP